MPIVVTNMLQGQQSPPYKVPSGDFAFGSSDECNFKLPGRAVPPVAFVVEQDDSGRRLVVKADNCVEFQEETLVAGDVKTLDEYAEVTISYAFSIKILFPKERKFDLAKAIEKLADSYADFEALVHQTALDRFGDWLNKVARERDFCDENLRKTEEYIDQSTSECLYRNHSIFDRENSALRNYIVGSCVRDIIIDTILETRRKQSNPFFADGIDFSTIVTTESLNERRLTDAAKIIAQKLFGDDASAVPHEQTHEILENRFWEEWGLFVKNKTNANKARDEYAVKRYLKKNVKDTLFGYGPLEDLLRSSNVSEIMVVNPQTIYVERNGKLVNSGRRFTSDESTLRVIENIVQKANRRINANEALVDARLLDGSRVNAVIAPLAVSGSCLTIRRFPEHRLTIDKLIEINSLTTSAAAFLQASVLARKNILVSGGTGTGKTTLLNCLCDYVPDNERIVTIEDTAELQIAKRHVVRLEARKKNIEGKGEYTIGDLVRNALRMRPDRIIVGECRGGEASDMLQAMNTGHDGSLTTIHANNTRDVILRLETLAQMGSLNIPVASIDRQIVAAVDLVVQLRRMRGGARRVSSISEIVGIDEETNEVVVRDIFALENDYDPKAKLSPTGRLPSFITFLLENNYLELERFYHDGP